MEASESSRKSYLLLASLALIWGSSFVLMKAGLKSFTPIQIGCLRMLFAVLVMTPFLVKGFQTIQVWQWKWLLVTGMFGNAIPSILFPLAQTGITSALAGMINTLTPIFTVLLGVLFFGMVVPRRNMFGLLVGMAGAVMLIAGGNGTIEATSPLYPSLVVCATLCYGISVNVLKHRLSGLHPLTITSFALLFIGIPMGAYLFSTDFLDRASVIFQGSAEQTETMTFSLGAIFILGVVGTALSTVMFNKLIQLSGPMVASSVTYLIPIVATCWGLFFGEHIAWMHVAGLASVLSGVYLINQQRG